MPFPDFFPTTQKAERALAHTASVLNATERGEQSRATSDIKAAIASFALVLGDYGVTLQSVLPTEACNVCGRPAIEYGMVDNRVTCIVCAHKRLEEQAQFDRDDAQPESDPLMSRLGVLHAAVSAVHDRGDKHGSPGATFPRIAAMWNVLLRETRFTAIDVALCLAALKLIRASVNPRHADNWVDVAGYAACGSEVADELAPQAVVAVLERHLREMGVKP